MDRFRADAGPSAAEPTVDAVAGWLVDSCRVLPRVDAAFVLAADATGELGPITECSELPADLVAAARAAHPTEEHPEWRRNDGRPGLDVRVLIWPDGVSRLLCLRSADGLGAEHRAVVDALAAMACWVAGWWTRAAADRRTVAELQTALDSRVIVEQAKGFLAARALVTPNQAFELLRRHARSTNRRLAELAREVVADGPAAEHLAMAAARPGGPR